MQTDQMREAFEAKFPSARGDRCGRGYAHQRNQDRWMGWQAAYIAGMERAAEIMARRAEQSHECNAHAEALAERKGADAIRAALQCDKTPTSKN